MNRGVILEYGKDRGWNKQKEVQKNCNYDSGRSTRFLSRMTSVRYFGSVSVLQKSSYLTIYMTVPPLPYDRSSEMLNVNCLVLSVVTHSHVDRVVKLVLPILQTDIRRVRRNLPRSQRRQHVQHGYGSGKSRFVRITEVSWQL